jgi:hypothetical protein
LNNKIDSGLQGIDESVQTLRKDVKDGLEQERTDRLRDRETFYEDMDRVCTGLDNRISKEADELNKLVDEERAERMKSGEEIKNIIQDEKATILNKLEDEKTLLQNDIAEVRADVEETKETGNEDIEALRRLLEEEKEAREAEAELLNDTLSSKIKECNLHTEEVSISQT